MAQKQVERVTMFKVAPENLPKFVSAYNNMSTQSNKDGKPYILSLKAGPTNASDPRSQGFTFAAISRFGSIEDMKYYDDGDQAHDELKQTIKPMVQGVMTIYFEDAL